jgi:hypothetical protein
MAKKRPRITSEVLHRVLPPTGVGIHTISRSSEVVGEAPKSVADRFRQYLSPTRRKGRPVKISAKKRSR